MQFSISSHASLILLNPQSIRRQSFECTDRYTHKSYRKYHAYQCVDPVSQVKNEKEFYNRFVLQIWLWWFDLFFLRMQGCFSVEIDCLTIDCFPPSIPFSLRDAVCHRLLVHGLDDWSREWWLDKRLPRDGVQSQPGIKRESRRSFLLAALVRAPCHASNAT